MATVNRGILDGFIGKVGTVVGMFWKGIPVMTGYTRSRRDKKSPSQVEQRMRFGALAQLGADVLDATLLGLRKAAAARRITETNLFIRLNMPMATVTGSGTLSVDFTGLVLAKGNLVGVSFDAPQFDTPQHVKVEFATPIESHKTHAEDEVYLFLYCPDTKSGLLSAAVKRSEGAASVEVPTQWNGLKVHVWGFTMGCELSERPGEASDSLYLGSGTIG